MPKVDDNLTPCWPSNNPPIDEVWPTIAEVQADPGVSPDEALRQLAQFAEMAGRYDVMLADLAAAHANGGALVFQRTAAVLAVVQFIPARRPLEDDARRALLALLLPPLTAKQFHDLLRGMIAAAVHTLRGSDLDLAAIYAWLTRELAARNLGVDANTAIQWFHRCREFDRCGESRMPPGAMAAFKDFQLPQALAEAPAKQRAAALLDTVALLKVAPLRGKKRD
jgi:hypothetical protein